MQQVVKASWLVILFCGLCLTVAAQVGVDGRKMFPGPDDEEKQPKTLQESLYRMQVEREKKDHDEMVARGEEAAKIATEIQESFAKRGSLAADDLSKVAKVEKLVKKIRDELGGDGDESKNEDPHDPDVSSTPASTGGAIEALKNRADALYDQLKQTTRFTISAGAIYTSNSLLKITKFLKLPR